MNAYELGRMMGKQATHPMVLSGLLHGGIGAGIGGLSGLIAPGQEATGENRSRLKAMLLRMLQGGMIGGSYGAGIEAFDKAIPALGTAIAGGGAATALASQLG